MVLHISVTMPCGLSGGLIIARRGNLGNDIDSHVNNIYNKPNICPKCGNSLVVRTAKSGVNAGHLFYGCNNYSNCR